MLALGTTPARQERLRLSLEAELKQLRVLRSVASAHPVEIVRPFWAPTASRGASRRPEEYVRK